MRTITGADRLAILALAIADIGIGVFLVSIGSLPGIPVWHTVAGVVALGLALPALAAVVQGKLTAYADEGVLVNVAVMTFMTLEVVFLPAAAGQKIGLAILLLAATAATMGLYLRLFGVLRLPRFRGRHHDG